VAVRELDFSEIMICNSLINMHVNFAKTAILLFSDSHLGRITGGGNVSTRRFVIRVRRPSFLADSGPSYSDTSHKLNVYRLKSAERQKSTQSGLLVISYKRNDLKTKNGPCQLLVNNAMLATDLQITEILI
jgi:hypothetical protein